MPVKKVFTPGRRDVQGRRVLQDRQPRQVVVELAAGVASSSSDGSSSAGSDSSSSTASSVELVVERLVELVDGDRRRPVDVELVDHRLVELTRRAGAPRR